jgi:hypothetical protein
MAGAVLVHDMEERNLAAAGGVVFCVNEHCYAALADGPDVGANGTTVAESYVQRDVLGSDEKTERGPVAVIGKNGRRLLLLLSLGWMTALMLVAMRSFVWEEVWRRSGGGGNAIALKDPPLGPGDPGVPIPYPKTLTAYHCRPAKNWISGKCFSTAVAAASCVHCDRELRADHEYVVNN